MTAHLRLRFVKKNLSKSVNAYECVTSHSLRSPGLRNLASNSLNDASLL